ncbi:MAG: aminopeptidase [Bacteroidales bacterium]|nr:MAG: aminopeptidase [Bacteroidales bacterium]
MSKFFCLTLLIISLVQIFQERQLKAQNTEYEGYKLAPLKVLEATRVKNQYNSSTCWSFSVISMLESELLRLNKGNHDLSEMFIIRHTYPAKAEKYVRMHGHINFSGGGAPNDVIDVIKKFGIVPEKTYPTIDENLIYCQMDSLLKEYIHNVVSGSNKRLNAVWYNDYNKILDTYLGELPDTFDYDSITFTPLDFAEQLGLNMDDYILITSYTHHPFYSKFILEVPDNWSWGKAYNVPLDELVEIIDSAVFNDYTVVWSADISEKGFSFANGLAIMPEGVEKPITQEMRQDGFDNYTTTDDHGLHITGIAEDQNNTKYYYVKNSWGTSNIYNGYMYVSEAYVRYKTMSIMLNKNAVPEKIAEKLKLSLN